ncbi:MULTISPECIES: DUF1837 domain-containing protein [Candidatus Kuenenia]|uniref:Anti-bacteriophage protein A/HamA C-terminal domain-containing protein n=1 Tax=Kuenenia stuttgartiensis TaxID=174633 RepID=Q1Q010_KUEST|nr:MULTISPECIES: DUF1837 domain-containing protein [Kuenenia]MCZ7621801.1 DUF1837 domain-containing protein [Candidatus Kuenenia sp.]CAJ72663.1 conserved hypothetical protein [Candidatus Kuenenia stuttgartiensis]
MNSYGLYAKAASKFRDYNQNDGEAGVLLLLCFLEAHLQAPEISTKLEIKLSSNDYAKGSDAIRLPVECPKKIYRFKTVISLDGSENQGAFFYLRPRIPNGGDCVASGKSARAI